METLGFHLRLRRTGDLNLPAILIAFLGGGWNLPPFLQRKFYRLLYFPYGGCSASHLRIMISMQHGGRVRSLSISDSEPRKGIHTSLFRVSRPKYFQHGSTTYLLNIIVEQVKRLIGMLTPLNL